MLVETRKKNESSKIEPVDGVDPSLTLREVFAHGPIVLEPTHVGQRRVRIVAEAPGGLKIARNEAPAIACADAEPAHVTNPRSGEPDRRAEHAPV